MLTSADVEERDSKLDPAILRVAAVVLLGPFMSQVDSTVVNVSLSAIRDDLHSSTEVAQWIVSGYLIALALMLPLNGWLVGRLGRAPRSGVRLPTHPDAASSSAH